MQPLLTRYAVELNRAIAPGLPAIAIHPEALLQILINLLSIAVHQSTAGQIALSARLVEWEIFIKLDEVRGSQSARPLSEADQASLAVAHKLVELANGALILSEKLPFFPISVRLPTLKSLPILVIDDSPDNIKLLQRYLAGTRYQMSSLNQPERALDLIERTRPQIVMLDLMMPQVDGLEILTRLHSNPATCQIPVIVCTILPQEELALSLGASAFLQKPVMQENLLAVLDRLASAREINSD